MRHGYDGTAVLWKCGIDHLIATLPDCGNCIQCVKIKGPEPILLVRAYMPLMVCRNASMSLRIRWTSSTRSQPSTVNIRLSLVETLMKIL